MRRTTAVISTLLVALLTLVGVADPAHAAPTPARDVGCVLDATPTVSGGGTTSSIKLKFSYYGVAFFQAPAWSYQVRFDDTAAVVASNSFAAGNNQQDSVDTTGWNTGSYTARASFGDPFPSCTTTFNVQGVDDPDEGGATQHGKLPPTATIDCGPSEVTLGTTIDVEGTAYDDHGVSSDKIRFPDGTETPGNTGTWKTETVGATAFAYFVVDTDGNQANDLCHVEVVLAPEPTPETQPDSPTPPIDLAPAEDPIDPGPATTPPAEPGTAGVDDKAEVVTGNYSRGDDTSGDRDDGSDDGRSDDDNADGSDEPAAALDTEPSEDAADEVAGVTASSDGSGDVTTASETPDETDRSATADLSAAVEATAADQEPPSQPSPAADGISLPLWLLILIAVLAAYKPVTDLWRIVTQPGRLKAHHNPAEFGS